MADKLMVVLSLSNAGKSYVIFSKKDNTDIDLSVIATGTGGFVINGETAGDYSSHSVSNAGELYYFDLVHR
jgi:hypothetical protein